MLHAMLKGNFFVTIVIASAFLFAACSNSNSQSNKKPSESSAKSAAGSATSDDPELKDAPNFTLTKMNGESFTLSEHEGKVVVLNVWATWCPPCRKEIPDFIEIQKDMRDEGVLFVGVSVDREGWEVVRPFAEEYGINYPLLVDDGTINNKYGPFRGIPTTFIINKKGKVEYVAPGMINRGVLEPALDELVSR